MLTGASCYLYWMTLISFSLVQCSVVVKLQSVQKNDVVQCDLMTMWISQKKCCSFGRKSGEASNTALHNKCNFARFKFWPMDTLYYGMQCNTMWSKSMQCNYAHFNFCPTIAIRSLRGRRAIKHLVGIGRNQIEQSAIICTLDWKYLLWNI